MRHQNDLETQKKAREKSVSVLLMMFFSLHKIMNQELFLCYLNIENICYSMSLIQNIFSRESQNVESGEGDVEKKRLFHVALYKDFCCK